MSSYPDAFSDFRNLVRFPSSLVDVEFNFMFGKGVIDGLKQEVNRIIIIIIIIIIGINVTIYIFYTILVNQGFISTAVNMYAPSGFNFIIRI